MTACRCISPWVLALDRHARGPGHIAVELSSQCTHHSHTLPAMSRSPPVSTAGEIAHGLTAPPSSRSQPNRSTPWQHANLPGCWRVSATPVGDPSAPALCRHPYTGRASPRTVIGFLPIQTASADRPSAQPDLESRSTTARPPQKRPGASLPVDRALRLNRKRIRVPVAATVPDRAADQRPTRRHGGASRSHHLVQRIHGDIRNALCSIRGPQSLGNTAVRLLNVAAIGL